MKHFIKLNEEAYVALFNLLTLPGASMQDLKFEVETDSCLPGETETLDLDYIIKTILNGMEGE